MSIEIELNTNDCQVQSRKVNGKNGPREIHEQRAYFHTGGAYPTPFNLSLRDPSQAYPSGKYTLDPSSFQVNGYGGLELNRFEIRLVPIKPSSLKATGS